MVLKIGNTDFAKGYIGTLDVQKAYLGDTEIYTKSIPFSYIGSSYYRIIANINTVYLDKPSGTNEGDIMFILIGAYGTSVNVPSGWTLLRDGTDSYYRGHLLYKIAGASEPSSYTVTTNRSNRTIGAIYTYRGGFNPLSPIDTTSQGTASISATSIKSPIITLGVIYSTGPSFSQGTSPGVFTLNDSLILGTYPYWSAFSSSTVWLGSGATGALNHSASAMILTDFNVILNP